MSALLYYLFYPNPGHLTYQSTQIIVLLVLCIGMILGSFLLRFWRTKLNNASTKKLSRSWSSTAFWFGVVGLFMTVSRVEKIQFIAIRFMWVIWAALLVVAIVVQYKIFRMRHYEVLPRVGKTDPRDQYLPGKKR